MWLVHIVIKLLNYADSNLEKIINCYMRMDANR